MIPQQILQILDEKQTLLEKLIKVIQLQKSCFDNNSMDEEQYEKLQTEQDKLIVELNQCNNQFEDVFPHVKVELELLIQKNDAIAMEIHTESDKLQKLSQEFEKESQELKVLFQQYINSERKAINEKRKQSKTATVYYKSMTKQMERMSYFYDRSK